MKNKLLVFGLSVAVLLILLGIPERQKQMPDVKGSIAAQNGGNPLKNQLPSPLPSVPPQNATHRDPNVVATGNSEPAAEFKTWLTVWRTSGADLTKGRELAVHRREQMLRKFKEDPAGAYADSLSWSQWNSVPEQLKDLVERPFSAMVDFSLLPNCPPADPSSAKIHPRKLRLDGEWRETHVFGTKATLTSKESLPARGILLDGKVLLSDAAFEQLSAEDLAVAAELFPTKDGPKASGLAGGSEPRSLLLGGII